MSDETKIKDMGAIPHAGGSPFACGRRMRSESPSSVLIFSQ